MYGPGDAGMVSGTDGELVWRTAKRKNVQPISPELALVDPDLAREAGDPLFPRPSLNGAHFAPIGTIPVRIRPARVRYPAARPGRHPTHSWRLPARWVIASLVVLPMCVVALAGIVATSRTPRSSQVAVMPSEAPPAAPDAAPRVGETTRDPTPSEPHSRRNGKQSAAAVDRGRAEAERRVLAEVARMPVGTLPAGLIDQVSGLPKNNLQAVCRSVPKGSFSCLVRPLRHRRDEGVRVKYRPTPGSGTFTWSRYRERTDGPE